MELISLIKKSNWGKKMVKLHWQTNEDDKYNKRMAIAQSYDFLMKGISILLTSPFGLRTASI